MYKRQLYTVLTTLAKTLAPLLPLITEEIYRGLTSEESVHLTDWPDPKELESPEFPESTAEFDSTADLVAQMDLAREVCSAVLRVREQTKIPVRIPLNKLTLAGAGVAKLKRAESVASEVANLIADEVNIKKLVLEDEMPDGFSRVLRPNGKLLGPRLKDRMQAVIATAKAGDWEVLPDGTAKVCGEILNEDEYTVAIEQASSKDSETTPNSGVLRDGVTVILLDTEVTPEQEREGLARHMVRIVQQGRRNQGLDVSDKIKLFLELPSDMEFAAREHEAFVAEQVLAVEITYSISGCTRVEKSEDANLSYSIERV